MFVVGCRSLNLIHLQDKGRQAIAQKESPKDQMGRGPEPTSINTPYLWSIYKYSSPSGHTFSEYNKLEMKLSSFLLISICQLAFLRSCNANQIDNLNELIKSRKSGSSSHDADQSSWENDDFADDPFFPVYVGSQAGLMGADEIAALPGQPGEGAVAFKQYAGYVSVEPKAGRELFYYFVESPHNSSTKPLLLWLNGGKNLIRYLQTISSVIL